jgi:hypothetical protein
MKLLHLAPLAAVLLTSTAAAHGPSTGAVVPHVHAEGSSDWAALLLWVCVGVVVIGIGAMARRLGR